LRSDHGGIDTFPTVQGSDASIEFRLEISQRGGSKALLLFEEPEGFPDDFTGRRVPAGLHFAGNEGLKLGGQRHVHGSLLSITEPS
jgi:hypothetical protein